MTARHVKAPVFGTPDHWQWLTSGDTGSSSETLFAAILGLSPPRFADYPLDSSDFGRCFRMLKRLPDLAEHLDRASALGPVWRRLVEHWPLLHALYEHEDFGLCYDVIKRCRGLRG